jgi:hypothetical protein
MRFPERAKGLIGGHLVKNVTASSTVEFVYKMVSFYVCAFSNAATHLSSNVGEILEFLLYIYYIH